MRSFARTRSFYEQSLGSGQVISGPGFLERKSGFQGLAEYAFRLAGRRERERDVFTPVFANLLVTPERQAPDPPVTPPGNTKIQYS